MQTLIALISALTTAVYFVYTSQVMKSHSKLSSTLTLALSHLIAAAALFIPWLFFFRDSAADIASPISGGLLLITACFLVMSRELYFYAYARTDVVNITVFSALTPVYTIASAFFLLHEVPSPLSLAGLLLICFSIYALFLKREPGKPLLASALQPFRAIAASRPIFCAFLSTIPTVFAAAFQKQLMSSLDPITFSFFLLFTIGFFALLISFLLFRPTELWQQAKQLPLGFIAASALLLPLMHVLFCLVIREHLTAVSLVLQRCSIVFQIIFAYYFLHEQRSIGKRLLIGAFIMAGFVLVIAGS